MTIGRDSLIDAITEFLGDRGPDATSTIRRTLEAQIDAAGPDAVAALGAHLATTGADWQYYPGDPLARRVHQVLASHFLMPGSGLRGIEHAAALVGKPVVIFPNHLSYSDANLFEVLLHRAGVHALADRLTVIAGPKVYSSLRRRFSSLCFGTIKVAQSQAVSSEDAVMSARDVARAARRSIDSAHARLDAGDALLVFAEGSRSRSGAMQALLPGAMRYLEGPDALVLPVGLTGTEALFPVGIETLHPVRVIAALGPPLSVRALRERAGHDRRLMIDAIGLAIAAQLPESYRGAYGDDVAGLDEARALLRESAAHPPDMSHV